MMIASETTPTAGLCSTCNNSETCFYRARRGPAQFCEMFDDYVAPHRPRNGRRSVAVGAYAAANEGASYAGLCVNCEHRQTCAHPKPAGGVWHCEDYE